MTILQVRRPTLKEGKSPRSHIATKIEKKTNGLSQTISMASWIPEMERAVEVLRSKHPPAIRSLP